MSQYIEMTAAGLQVPNTPIVPFITGDGVGAEVIGPARAIVDASVAKAYGGARRIDWQEVAAGRKSFDATGDWLPQATLDAFDRALVGLKGPLETPVGGGIRSLNVALRQKLDLYVCQRPVRWFEGVGSPVKEPGKVDMHIFRENTEDIYAGIEWESGSDAARKFGDFIAKEMGVTSVRFPETSAFGVKPVSREGSTRLVRAALQFAVEHKLPAVTLVHKGNIMKFTEGGFKKWGYELAQTEFADVTITQPEIDALAKTQGKDAAWAYLQEQRAAGKIYVNDCICDAFLQNALLYPERYSVIATMNLNGDYISDMLAAMVGGIGIAPGANINYTTGHAIFEATHGTAPDIAGADKVNPTSAVLSACMLLDYLGWKEASALVVAALTANFGRGMATADLARYMPNGQALSTSAFTRAVIEQIGQ